MEVDYKCVCTLCKYTLDLDMGYPYVNDQNQMCCIRCFNRNPTKFYGATVVNDTIFVILQKQVLKAHCHEEKQAYWINKDCFYLSCQECGSEVYSFSFEKIEPKKLLKNLLEQIIQEGRHDKEYLYHWKISLNQDIESMHKSLKEMFLLDSKIPICIIHFEKATTYDLKKFTFHCPSCPQSDNQVPHDDQNMNRILSEAFNCIRIAKTSAISTTILKAISCGNYDKNFLYAMHKVNDEKKASITRTSSCLRCFREFSLGKLYPIQIHMEERHEICYEYCQQGWPSTCFIDGENSVTELKLAPAYALFAVEGNVCKDHGSNYKFSYYNNIDPYNVCCPKVNICGDCKNSSTTTGFIQCPNCFTIKKINTLQINASLKNTLKHTEVNCDDPYHAGSSATCFNKETLQVYCDKCKNRGRNANNKNFFQFFTELNKKLYEQYQNAPSILMKSAIIDITLPLRVRLRLYKMLQQRQDLINLIRFTDYLPSENYDNLSQWEISRTDPPCSLVLSCDGRLELLGFFIGFSKIGFETLVISTNNETICNTEICYKVNNFAYQKVELTKSIIISSDPVEFLFTFSEGSYYHGDPKYREANLFVDNINIKLDSRDFSLRNNVIGGPIFGFIFDSFYICPKEL